MKALTVDPTRKHSAHLQDWTDSLDGQNWVEAAPLLIGVCGTDREIIEGLYGFAPPNEDRLVLGHECLARVLNAPTESDLAADDLIVPIVRRPDPVPCDPCAALEWDMCCNGLYTECGIKERHGFCRERFFIEPDYVVKVSSKLRHTGVLVEPASVVAKAWEHIGRIGARSVWNPKRLLVTGAGPVGLLAALMGVQRGLEVSVFDIVTEGPKPQLVEKLGAHYLTGSLKEVCRTTDIAIECTGVTSVLMDVLQCNAPNGIVCLTGLSSGSRKQLFDVGQLNQNLVLENDVIFGSVNANRRHYEQAVEALEHADPAWLEGLITRTVALENWEEAILKRYPNDVKVVIEINA
jgi:threonine dehydrogenase-like Zn-dependent dehydrogenase